MHLQQALKISYRKFLKYLDTPKNCWNHPKSWIKWRFLRVMHPKDNRGNCKQGRPWSDCSSGSSLIWVYTVFPDLSVRKLRKITVLDFLFDAQDQSILVVQWSVQQYSEQPFCLRPDAVIDYTLNVSWVAFVWGEGTFYVITFCVHKSFGTQFEWY